MWGWNWFFAQCDFCFYLGHSLCHEAVHLKADSLFPWILCILAPLSGLTLTFMRGCLGCLSRIVFVFLFFSLIWVTFLFFKVPDSVILNKEVCWIQGLGSCEDLSLLLAIEAAVVMMRVNLQLSNDQKAYNTHADAVQSIAMQTAYSGRKGSWKFKCQVCTLINKSSYVRGISGDMVAGQISSA